MKSDDERSTVSVVVDEDGSTKLAPGPPDEDPWALPDISDQGPRWSELTTRAKVRRIVVGIVKACCLLGLLWAFVCSLQLLSSSFRLLGGRQAGRVFRDSELLRNPVVGLMIGVLATVLVQSSSTSTSIVVTMVGAGLLRVKEAVPVVMGANIGTSVTNTLVSLGQAGDRNEFRRAFAAATVHDAFNWLAVAVLLPLEAATGYLENLTGAIMESGHWPHAQGEVTHSKSFLHKITDPFTSLIVQLDKQTLQLVASGRINDSVDVSLLKRCQHNGTQISCGYMLEGLSWSDAGKGALLLACSLGLLCSCLVCLVRLLHSVLGGPLAALLRRTINAEPPFPYSLVAGYAAMAAGCALTVLLQSSSVFTSALTPLAGVGMVSLERVYPLTLGANLGTTTTGLLAAFAAPSNRREALRIAFAHLFFNLTGILLFYPVPATRLPIPLAKAMGSLTARYRWVAPLYLVMVFVVLPAAVFALSSTGGPIALAAVGGPIIALVLLVVLVNIVQRRRPSMLPLWLRDWNFLPLWMHSLDPADRLISRCCCCCYKRETPTSLGLLPNPSQVNILQGGCSASSSVLTLDSAASGTEYHTMNGFENCAFGPPPASRKTPTHCNNNTIEWDFGNTTAL